MALSRIVAIGDGSTTTFTVAFALGYLNEDDVTCRVGDESDGAGNPLYRTITWLTPTQAQISGTAPGIGERVIFDRTVPRDQLIVDFEDNDIINEENMNTAQKQALMLVHEVMDGRFDSLDTDIDLGGFRIINLGTPVEPDDAVNKAYVDTRITLAEGYATAAHNSAIAAASSASSAQGAALSANQAKDDAEDARDQVVIMYNTFTDIYSNFAGGTSGQVLAKASSDDFDYEWQTLPGTGDMLASVYDPQSIGDDAFDRANHTGTQGADTITGLADVAVSGDYDDLDNLPALGSAAGASTSDFATAAQGAKADAALPKSGGEMTDGISFGSEYSASPQSNSRHIALYSTTHGFNVTADYLNYNSANRHRWLVNGTAKAVLTDTMFSMSTGVTLRLSGDPSNVLDAASKQYVDNEVSANAVTSGKITSALGYTPAGFYTGSTVDNTNYPIGSIIAVSVGTTTALRNATPSDPIRLGGTGTERFSTSGAYATLSGTWRARGICGYASSGSTTLQLFQRTA